MKKAWQQYVQITPLWEARDDGMSYLRPPDVK